MQENKVKKNVKFYKTNQPKYSSLASFEENFRGQKIMNIPH